MNKLAKYGNYSGEDVRCDDGDDKTYEATRNFRLSPNITLHKGNLIRFNGKSAVFRAYGYSLAADEETCDLVAIEYGIRRGWLKLWKERKEPLKKRLIGWFRGFLKKNYASL